MTHSTVRRYRRASIKTEARQMAPHESEQRTVPSSPAPELSMDELFAEMAANDPEFHAWREAEARATLR